LLSPQHWAQEAKDNFPVKHRTNVLTDEDGCTIVWKQRTRQKKVLHDPLTNTPIFCTAPGSSTYRAFEATFITHDTSHQKEQIRFDLDRLRGTIEQDPAEFVADEDIHCPEQWSRANEGVSEDEQTVKTSITASSKQLHQNGQADRIGPLTFSPIEQLDEADQLELGAEADNPQAELMRWYYRLGHLPFNDLKKLAENGEIPKKLAKVNPPRCAGCLFGAMTKVPWRTKSKESGKQVFKASIGQVKSSLSTK
jgi:hypothetical protein